MRSPPLIDGNEPAPCEPDGPSMSVCMRGDEVLALIGDSTFINASMPAADRAVVAAFLSRALAITLETLAADIAMSGEPVGHA